MFWKITSFLLAIGIACLVYINDPIFYLMFSNKEYQKNLIIEPYIMKEEQLCGLFEKNITNQLNNEELLNEQLYLVLCIRNIGDHAAWGELQFVVNNQSRIKINVPHISRNKKIHKFVVHYSGGVDIEKKEAPEIKYQWEKLFTK